MTSLQNDGGKLHVHCGSRGLTKMDQQIKSQFSLFCVSSEEGVFF